MSIQPMPEPPDPILEELHATRRQLLKEHGGISGLAAFLRKEEAKTTRTMAEPSGVSRPNEALNPTGNKPTN